MPLYLGLDASTQSLTGIVLEVTESRREIVWQHSLNFDAEFPRYGTSNGVLASADPLVAVSSPVLWAEALDRFFALLVRESDLELAQLRAVSGAAQQHGSVYLTRGAGARLAKLDATKPLSAQVPALLSRREAPIWMDASTTAQCAAITEAVGGPDALQRLTGSRAFERFTGPQIRKFFETDPDGYARTARIHVVSSFLASLLVGQDAPTEPGDAAGMNLMDIEQRQWAQAALRATAPDLEPRLPRIVPPWTTVGRLASYWTTRYRLPSAKVIAWTGDNPSSTIGVGLVRPDRLAISLGTSDTVFGLMQEPRFDPSGAGNVFGAPNGAWMALVCFRNGALARERVREVFGLDWEGFAQALSDSSPGNEGRFMLPWFEEEITPPVRTRGVQRFGFDESDLGGNVRGVIEAQMMATAVYTEWMRQDVRVIHATGGGARTLEILRVMANVHDADVYRLNVTASAALGAALRAWHGDATGEGRELSWEDVVRNVAEPPASTVVRPDPEAVAVYAELKRAYASAISSFVTDAAGKR